MEPTSSRLPPQAGVAAACPCGDPECAGVRPCGFLVVGQGPAGLEVILREGTSALCLIAVSQTLGRIALWRRMPRAAFDWLRAQTRGGGA